MLNHYRPLLHLLMVMINGFKFRQKYKAGAGCVSPDELLDMPLKELR